MGKKQKGGGDRKSNSLIGLYQALAAAIVLLLAYSLGKAHFQDSQSSHRQDSIQLKPWNYIITGQVKKLLWDSQKAVVEPMLALNEPRVLENTFASQWAAASGPHQWNPDYLSSRLPETLAGVYSRKSPIFGPLFRPKNQRVQQLVDEGHFPRLNPFQAIKLN